MFISQKIIFCFKNMREICYEGTIIDIIPNKNLILIQLSNIHNWSEFKLEQFWVHLNTIEVLHIFT